MDEITMNYYEESGVIIYFSDNPEINALMQVERVQEIIADLLIQFDDATTEFGSERIQTVEYKNNLKRS